MTEEFDASKPIYMQLAERINKKIIRNELGLGEKLPSVREMAVQSGVNPNTVQRTYSELERMGIVETRRGQGTFVTENKEVIKRLREQLKQEIMSEFVRNMKELGFTMDEIITSLKDINQKEGGV
ncbi:GntR family transcriptional regulator [Anoxybacillus calidus]|jgi:GntR family transcriptional regulator|uniref:GntR family transcriptional regulator n=1 Tax=[Anoxybacillus] calidus TaxID=575178 RepID=A0A7V9YWJ1_9BACL|nr:GntR family transcriptional regulator [Anoxybacillus calidus]MBA2869767.1 GntR family transcriptional regulator [Anoxybacillus calidus]